MCQGLRRGLAYNHLGLYKTSAISYNPFNANYEGVKVFSNFYCRFILLYFCLSALVVRYLTKRYIGEYQSTLGKYPCTTCSYDKTHGPSTPEHETIKRHVTA